MMDSQQEMAPRATDIGFGLYKLKLEYQHLTQELNIQTKS